MLHRFFLIFFFVFALSLTACVQTPFVDSRREAGFTKAIGESTEDKVAICYNTYSTNANELIKMAQDECEKTDREPAYDSHKYWSCRVFLPHRVYYRCQEKPQEERMDEDFKQETIEEFLAEPKREPF